MGILGYLLGLYWDNGKESGTYYTGFWVRTAWCRDSDLGIQNLGAT